MCELCSNKVRLPRHQRLCDTCQETMARLERITKGMQATVTYNGDAEQYVRDAQYYQSIFKPLHASRVRGA